MAENPTFARHGDSTINFQFVGSYDKDGETDIKIELGNGRIDIWEFDDTTKRDDAYEKLDSLYTDEI